MVVNFQLHQVHNIYNEYIFETQISPSEINSATLMVENNYDFPHIWTFRGSRPKAYRPDNSGNRT